MSGVASTSRARERMSRRVVVEWRGGRAVRESFGSIGPIGAMNKCSSGPRVETRVNSARSETSRNENSHGSASRRPTNAFETRGHLQNTPARSRGALGVRARGHAWNRGGMAAPGRPPPPSAYVRSWLAKGEGDRSAKSTSALPAPAPRSVEQLEADLASCVGPDAPKTAGKELCSRILPQARRFRRPRPGRPRQPRGPLADGAVPERYVVRAHTTSSSEHWSAGGGLPRGPGADAARLSPAWSPRSPCWRMLKDGGRAARPRHARAVCASRGGRADASAALAPPSPPPSRRQRRPADARRPLRRVPTLRLLLQVRRRRNRHGRRRARGARCAVAARERTSERARPSPVPARRRRALLLFLLRRPRRLLPPFAPPRYRHGGALVGRDRREPRVVFGPRGVPRRVRRGRGFPRGGSSAEPRGARRRFGRQAGRRRGAPPREVNPGARRESESREREGRGETVEGRGASGGCEGAGRRGQWRRLSRRARARGGAGAAGGEDARGRRNRRDEDVRSRPRLAPHPRRRRRARCRRRVRFGRWSELIVSELVASRVVRGPERERVGGAGGA